MPLPSALGPSSLLVCHYCLIALALVGVVAVQGSWAVVLPSTPVDGWRPYVAATLLSTTAWLASTAWIHWRLARSARPKAAGSLAARAISNALVAAYAGIVLAQGHASPVALAGLWSLCPLLLAVAAPAAIVQLAAAYGALRERPNAPSTGQLRPDFLSAAIVAALFLSLGLLATRPMPTGIQSAPSWFQSGSS